jgi:DNA-binding response OmpR family regulator
MVKNEFKVFIMEDDKQLQEEIVEELKNSNYRIHFFSKDESIFELMKFSPDILIRDYKQNKVINCYELSLI